MGDQALAHIAQRGCGVSTLEDFQKPSGHGPEQDLNSPTCAGLLGQVRCSQRSVPKPEILSLCVSVIFLKGESLKIYIYEDKRYPKL